MTTWLSFLSNVPHVESAALRTEADAAAHDAEHFVSVIDKVLALNYLRPSLKERVVELRERMVRNLAHLEPPDPTA